MKSLFSMKSFVPMKSFSMKLFFLLAALLLLPGCSAIKIVYNQADSVAAWRADDYFDLNSTQKEALRVQLVRFHAWHRASQLADYAALLESVQRRIHAGVSTDDVSWAVDAVKARYRTLVLHAYPDAARLLATLSDQQVEAARRRFDKDNRKYAKEYGIGAPLDEQRRLRAQRTLERIEHWTGPLTTAQETRLREMSRALPLIADLRQQDRMRRQREFLALLAERKHVETFAPKLRDWLLGWEHGRSPEYEARLARFVEASAQIYVEAFGLLTVEQRNHVASRLTRYMTAFRELAQEPTRTAQAALP